MCVEDKGGIPVGSPNEKRENLLVVAGLVVSFTLVVGLIELVGILFPEAQPDTFMPYVSLALTVWQLGISYFLFATQSHRWAHTPADQVPAWAATLQRLRLFLPIEEHAKHHDHLDRSWGICNGWSNPFLDAIDYREKHIWIRTQLLGSGRPLWEHQRAVRGLSG